MSENLEKKIFLICPVRNITDKENQFLQEYISELESNGNSVHYPPRDTNQDDPIGYNICTENCAAIDAADEVHIYWNPGSSGSGFDLGMAFMGQKPIKLINKDKIPKTPHKSFENVLHELDKKYGL